MLTIFTLPKPFTDKHINIIQRNAIKSWTLLKPKPEVILLGDDRGIKEAAQDFQAKHIPRVKRNKYGTPLLDSAFSLAREQAKHEILCYVNADIIFLQDFLKILDYLPEKKEFLVVGRRWNLDIKKLIDFNRESWREILGNKIRKKAKLHPAVGSDYFIFRRESFDDLPPFIVGRASWDNALIYLARMKGLQIINNNIVPLVIHQNHRYLPQQRSALGWSGPEKEENIRLAGGRGNLLDLSDATHWFNGREIRKIGLNPKRTKKYLVIFLKLIFYRFKAIKKQLQRVEEISYIRPKRGLVGVDFKELYQYRDLLWSLVARDIKVKYKQTVIGGLWAILQPFLTMVVFTFFFGKLARMPSEGIPYPLFSYTGLILWTYFANSVSSASNSLVANANLISKVYFPRLILPLAATLTGLLDYLIAGAIVFGLMVYYQWRLPIQAVFLPLIFLFTWILGVGLGFFLAAINIKYRDIRYAIPFFLQLLIFITPVIFPLSVAGKFQKLLLFNPMTGFIENHRILILGHQPLNWLSLSVSVFISGLIFLAGVYYFRRVEKYFADLV